MVFMEAFMKPRVLIGGFMGLPKAEVPFLGVPVVVFGGCIEVPLFWDMPIS